MVIVSNGETTGSVVVIMSVFRTHQSVCGTLQREFVKTRDVSNPTVGYLTTFYMDLKICRSVNMVSGCFIEILYLSSDCRCHSRRRLGVSIFSLSVRSSLLPPGFLCSDRHSVCIPGVVGPAGSDSGFGDHLQRNPSSLRSAQERPPVPGVWRAAG